MSLEEQIISQHIFAPNRGYRVYYPSNLFRNARSILGYSPGLAGGIFGHVTCIEQSRASKNI